MPCGAVAGCVVLLFFAELNTALDQYLKARVMSHASVAPPVEVMTCFHDCGGVTLG